MNRNGFVLGASFGLLVTAALVLFQAQTLAPAGGSSGGSTTLTSTQVGYGDGSNAVTGEAAFNYNAATNVLTAGVHRAPDGSAGTPAFSFTDDPDTGMFSSTGNTLSFGTGGAERWRMRSTGALVPIAATYTVGDAAARTHALYMTTTDNSGTPGNTTINTGRGRAAIAGAATSVVITNSLSATSSACIATLATNDASCVSVRSCIVGASSLTIAVSAACTGTTVVDFVLFP